MLAYLIHYQSSYLVSYDTLTHLDQIPDGTNKYSSMKHKPYLIQPFYNNTMTMKSLLPNPPVIFQLVEDFFNPSVSLLIMFRTLTSNICILLYDQFKYNTGQYAQYTTCTSIIVLSQQQLFKLIIIFNNNNVYYLILTECCIFTTLPIVVNLFPIISCTLKHYHIF